MTALAVHPSSRARLSIAAPVLALSLLAADCSSGPPPPADDRPYDQRIADARQRKDADFKAPDNPYSPVPLADRAAFPGIPYYPVQPEFRVPASLTEVRSNSSVVIALTNSAHQIEQKVKVGTLTFTVGGKSYSLSAFAEDGDVRRLWVPFRDLTSGIETYGGGRYLDLERTATGVYDLDFNREYHPSCVYDVSWVCPYPPSENRLPVAIRAGERLAK